MSYSLIPKYYTLYPECSSSTYLYFHDEPMLIGQRILNIKFMNGFCLKNIMIINLSVIQMIVYLQ